MVFKKFKQFFIEPRYYYGDLHGLTEEFKIDPKYSLAGAIANAEKENLGRFIFVRDRLHGGYKEIKTGKVYQFYDFNPAYNFYSGSMKPPKDSGVYVDKTSLKRTTKEIAEKYRNKLNTDDLTKYLDDIQARCDSYLREATDNTELRYTPVNRL